MKSVASLYINGCWEQGNGGSFSSDNPATGERIWQGGIALPEQVALAVQAAQKASERWRELAPEQRQGYVRKFTELVEQYRELLADTLGQETGKPLWECRTEIAAMIGKMDISIRAQQERCPERVVHNGTTDLVLRHRPHGVVAIFGPYNLPLHLPNGHIIPALLAGNTVVFKPSELTPRCGELMVHLWHKAELPDGVLNLVQGGRDTGAALASDPAIDGLFFTGSADTGKLLHRQFGGYPEKILALEMGGNNPLIVTQLGNLKAAIHDTLFSAFISAGQRCTCARRLFVPQGSWGDTFLDQLVEAGRRIRVGEYNSDPAPFMGSLISKAAATNILNAQQSLIHMGAVSLLKSEVLNDQETMLSPAIIDVTPIAELPDQEYFGPLLQVIRYTGFDSALAQANNTAYGLSAGLFSDKREQYELFQRRIRAGIVNWNRPLTGASSALPFGGCGSSGNNRPSAYYAADYCAYPVASMESDVAELPDTLSPGLEL